MDKQIRKLLLSESKEDILIGWELFKQRIPKGPEWYPYLDIVRSQWVTLSPQDLIGEAFGDNFREDPLWINWDPEEMLPYKARLKDENTNK